MATGVTTVVVMRCNRRRDVTLCCCAELCRVRPAPPQPLPPREPGTSRPPEPSALRPAHTTRRSPELRYHRTLQYDRYVRLHYVTERYYETVFKLRYNTLRWDTLRFDTIQNVPLR